jgi:hypothetical protein
MKCFAKRPLAHLKRATQGWNVEWLVYVRESQILRLIDKVMKRLVFSRGGGFFRSCERPVNAHQST